MNGDPLSPDLAQAEAFLALLDPEATSWTFQTFDDWKAKRRGLARVIHGTLEGCAESLRRMNAQGAGIFVTVNRTDGNGRKAENITGIRSLFTDEDAPLQHAVALEPSIIVTADRGKHYYWKVAAGATLAAFKPAQKHLISFYGSDPDVNDLPRVMRLPGFFHMKHEPKLVTFSGGSGKVYTIEEILAAHPIEKKATASTSSTLPTSATLPTKSKATSLPGDRIEKLERIVLDVADSRSWAESSRHASAKATATHARKLDLPRDRVETIVSSYLVKAGKSADEAADVVAWTFENVSPDPDEAAPRTSTSTATRGALALAPTLEPEAEYEWIEAPAEDYPAPLAEAAYHGLAGRIVRLLEPHTEADPVGVLLQLVVAFGNSVGREPYYRVGPTSHRAVEFVGIVGETSVGRKGTSWSEIKYLFELAGDPWARERVCSGLSSGEGLIWEVRDPGERAPGGGQKGKVRPDPGVEDKRLLPVESELGRVLKAMQRDGQTLSGTLRELWDCPTHIRTMTKHSPIKATGPHVGLIGHVTMPEVRRLFDEIDVVNGLGNRILWTLVRRSKLLPDGGSLTQRERKPIADELAAALGRARAVRQMTRDDEARRIWTAVYGDLTADRQGLFGAVTRRAEAHVLRLSMIYALLDGSAVVGKAHLLAALAVWTYCEASARCIFGSSLGDPEADEILRALVATPDGLTRSDLRDLFNRNVSAARITRALFALQRGGLAYGRKETTAGRPSERWFHGKREVPK